MVGGDVAVEEGAKVTTIVPTALSGAELVGEDVIFESLWVSMVVVVSTAAAVDVGLGVIGEATVGVCRGVAVARGATVATGEGVAVGTIGSGVGVAVTVTVSEGPAVGRT